MTADSYQVQPTAVRSLTSDVSGMVGRLGSVVGELESTVLDGTAFAGLGSMVASANDTMQSQLVSVLRGAMDLFEKVNGDVATSADGYTTADEQVAQGYGAQSDTATPTQAQTPAQPTGLSSQVVDSIMRAEGASGEQGGVPEAYGFRQNMHNGYDQIMAARNQYGQGSPEERAVVTQLLNQEAQNAGALNFTDPGEQAAIMSASHMRGAGGAQAILNSMVTGTVQRSGTLTPDTIQSIQQMTPQDFQQQFHDARITYDQTIYGNTTTHQGGHTDTWWHRYGNGLTTRYDNEQQQFLGMSPEQ
jgi:hypothetical protein